MTFVELFRISRIAYSLELTTYASNNFETILDSRLTASLPEPTESGKNHQLHHHKQKQKQCDH